MIFGDFFTIFAYKIINIDVESTKIATKMQTVNKITQKILKMKLFENLGQNWANFDKKCPFFTKFRFIQNHILQYNLSYSEARVLKFGKCIQRKITKKSQEAEI